MNFLSKVRLSFLFSIRNYPEAKFVISLIHTSCWYANFCLFHNLSCTYYLLLHTDIPWYIPPLISFSTISNIFTFVHNFNFTSVFFRYACQANPGADKRMHDQAHIFQCICCKRFWIPLLIVAYHYSRIDHDTVLRSYSKIFPDSSHMLVVSICDVFRC